LCWANGWMFVININTISAVAMKIRVIVVRDIGRLINY
jgi:hypothetical protein